MNVMNDLEMLKFSLGLVESAGHDMAEIKCASLRKLMDALKQAEKDAARYHWLMNNAKLGIGRNGKDWDLQIDGPAPDSMSEVGEWIDNRIDGSAR